jgi:hypothetical protein
LLFSSIDFTMHLSRSLFLAATASAGHLSVDIQRRTPTLRSAANAKRGTVSLDTLVDTAGQAIYFVTLQLGTPPQGVELGLDTGSTDIIVNGVAQQAPVGGIPANATGRRQCE